MSTVLLINDNLFVENFDDNLGIIYRLLAFSRSKEFNQHHQVRLLTKKYNEYLTQNIKNLGFNSPVISMYDYFQGFTDIFNYANSQLRGNNDKNKVRNLPFCQDAVIQPASVRNHGFGFDVINGNETIKQVTVFDNNTVSGIASFDNLGHLVQKDKYDYRGFKSSTEYYDSAKHVVKIDYYDRKGKVVIQKFFGKDNHIDNIILNEDDYQLYFNNEDEMFTYFLSLVINDFADKDKVTCIVDKPELYHAIINTPIVDDNKNKVKRLFVIPTIHSKFYDKPVESELKDNIKVLFDKQYRANINGIIVATDKQRIDIIKHFEGQSPVPLYSANLGLVPNVQSHKIPVPVKNRHQYSFICMAHMDKSRNIQQLIDAFNILIKDVPNARLTICGSGCNDYVKSLHEYVNSLQLNDYIKFINYIPNNELDNVLNNTQCYINMAQWDAQSLGSILALGHGDLIIAHNVNYGFDKMVTTDYNGVLLPDFDINNPTQDVELLADAMKKIANLSIDEWQKWSDNSYHRSEHFDRDKYIIQWEKII